MTILQEYKEHLALMKEVFELETELLMRKAMFSRNGIKYEYPPPYLYEEFELYQDINFLRERLIVLKEHIKYTSHLLDKHNYTIDYTSERRKEEKWREDLWANVWTRTPTQD